MLNRLWYHSNRFRNLFWWGGGILFLFVAIFVFSFPNDDEVIGQFIGIFDDIGLAGFFGSFDLDSPGWVIWLALTMGTYINIVVAVTAIRIGARVVPTRDDDAIELLLAAPPRSGRRLFLENYLSANLVLLAAIVPSLLILILGSVIFDSSDIIVRLCITFLFTFVSGAFFMALTMTVTIFLFNRMIGMIVGFFYMIYALIIELSSNAVNGLIADNFGDLLSDFELDVAVISVNGALKSTQGLYDNEWEWIALLIVAALTLVLFAVSYWRIQSPEYIEKVGKVRRSRFSFLPTFNPRARLASRYPLVFDQFRKDRVLLFVWTMIFVLIYPYEMVLWKASYANDPAAFADLIASFDVPFLNALLGGHPVPASYTGFAMTQFYALSWLYYGLFVVLVAVGIPGREVSRETQDLLYANPVRQRDVIRARTIAMLVELTFLMGTVLLSNIIFGTLLDVDQQLGREALTFLVSWLYFGGMGVLFVAVSLLPRISSSRKVGLWLFLGTTLIFMLGSVSPDLDILTYFSFLKYIDPAGVLLDVIDIADQWVGVLIIWASALVLFFVGLRRYETLDQI